MNANQLLDLIGDVRSEYVAEAQYHRSGAKRTKVRMPAKRLVLIAAVIALLVALVGFATIVLNLDGLKLGDYVSENYTGASQEMTLLSMQGYNGTVNYGASKEWYDFRQNYDTDGALLKQADAQGYRAPAAYDGYLCYTDEMVAKVDAICDAYGLELLGPLHICDSLWMVLDRLGIQRIVDGNVADLLGSDGYYYEDGTFQVSGTLQLRESAAVWEYPVDFQYRSVKKTSFDNVFINVWNDVAYEQWEYETAKGEQLLLVLSEENALIFADKGDAFVTVIIPKTRVSDGEYGERTMNRAAMEALADCLVLDYKAVLQPVHDPVATVYYSDYADYIKELLGRGAVQTYALVQVDGIGDEELVIMDGNGIIWGILTIRDGYVQDMAQGGDLYLCEYSPLHPVMDVTAPDYVYVCRVIEQVSDVGGGTIQHYYTYINEEGAGVILDVLMECADGSFARSENGGAGEMNWKSVTREEYNALAGQYERLTLDRTYIGEFFGEHIPDYTLFDAVYLPIAEGAVSADWETVRVFIEEQGYTCNIGEGTFDVADPQNPDSYLCGELTTENGAVEIADVWYCLSLGDAQRTVRTRFAEGGLLYFVNEGFLRDGVAALDAAEQERFIKSMR